VEERSDWNRSAIASTRFTSRCFPCALPTVEPERFIDLKPSRHFFREEAERWIPCLAECPRPKKKIVAILWPEQPRIPVNGHNFTRFDSEPARPLAKAKLFVFSCLQSGSFNGSFQVLRFSIFKPGFDSR
jgi:hypothetical protein